MTRPLDCEFVALANRQRYTWICPACGLEVTTMNSQPPRANCRAKGGIDAPPLMPPGPGTELKLIFVILEIVPTAECDCDLHIARMNAWGVDGCREHFDEIVAWLRAGAKRYGWTAKVNAARKAISTGLHREIEWSDPFPSIIKIAISRAASKATTATGG
jgi:hypothetical protein